MVSVALTGGCRDAQIRLILHIHETLERLILHVHEILERLILHVPEILERSSL